MSSSKQELDILGIDISKAKFDVALLKNNNKDKIKSKVFANTPEGFEQLQQWLDSQGVSKLHGCMEATSIYGNALARFLVAAGYVVSIVNPSRPKAFGRSELSRTKTDRADAKVIAVLTQTHAEGTSARFESQILCGFAASTLDSTCIRNRTTPGFSTSLG